MIANPPTVTLIGSISEIKLIWGILGTAISRIPGISQITDNFFQANVLPEPMFIHNPLEQTSGKS